jgi:cell division protein FtsZ
LAAAPGPARRRDRQPRERTRRADRRGRHQAVQVRGEEAPTQAERGLEALRDCVDTIITIPNERLLAIIDRSTPLTEAFGTADDVLRQAIQGISDLILVPGLINLDFADVKTIMSGMGLAMMGPA